MSKILVRAISGIIYIALVATCVLWNEFSVAALASLFAILASIEFTMMNKVESNLNKWAIIINCLACVALACSFSIVTIPIWIFLTLVRFIMELYSKSMNPIKDLSHYCMTQVYIGIPLATMVILANYYSSYLLLSVFILIWLNDTGAFVFGSLLGKHKLFERISPKKTWEGFFGGVLMTIIGSLVLNYFWNSHIQLPNIGCWICLSCIVAIFATFGDLVESLMKRSVNIKDSGNIMPGHGGILDRIDSLLFVAPAVFIFIFLLTIV